MKKKIVGYSIVSGFTGIALFAALMYGCQSSDSQNGPAGAVSYIPQPVNCEKIKCCVAEKKDIAVGSEQPCALVAPALACKPKLKATDSSAVTPTERLPASRSGVKPSSAPIPEIIRKKLAFRVSCDSMPGMVQHNTEDYQYTPDNDFMSVSHSPLSTFSIDVDTASYANTRRFLLKQNSLPPADAVRIEELINYFTYDYPEPQSDMPLRPTIELSKCPWNKNHDLLLIGLQAKKIKETKLPPSNFVFLIDTSGSMTRRMPLVKKSMEMLAMRMRPQDHIAIVTYAGSAGLVLPSTSGEKRSLIADKINHLRSGGSTAGGAGIKLAYKVAKENFITNGNNRVVLITDGDFNVGVSSQGALVRMIEEKRKDNIFLTVLGVGRGNYKDSKMEMLADKGNGNYFYIDSIREAKKALVNEMAGNMFTVAKDVKIQIEFNPKYVKGYRLIGYVNRKLNDRDFKDDTKDAGEIGAGHQVTALYELVPAGSKEDLNAPAPLEFQKTVVNSDKLLNFKLRWKPPKADKSIEWVGYASPEHIKKTSDNFRHAAAVAEFGMLLRNSKYKGTSDWKQVMGMAQSAKGSDINGYRAEFIKMAETAELLKPVKTSKEVTSVD